ncbi:hypothetical protein LDENG_00171840 [Lucifuga dentata]|nr:hypothetical protein LDENG_00171840 [Lucifuga dentata]
MTDDVIRSDLYQVMIFPPELTSLYDAKLKYALKSKPAEVSVAAKLTLLVAKLTVQLR